MTRSDTTIAWRRFKGPSSGSSCVTCHAGVRNGADIATLYRERLLPFVKDDLLEIPEEPPRSEGIYHLYVVLIEDRDRVRRELERAGISTGLHYPVRLHLQKALANLGKKKGDFPVTERISARCLSLPIFPEMREEQVDTVVGTLAKAPQA